MVILLQNLHSEHLGFIFFSDDQKCIFQIISPNPAVMKTELFKEFEEYADRVERNTEWDKETLTIFGKNKSNIIIHFEGDNGTVDFEDNDKYKAKAILKR
jgi:hypothetical protein